MCRWTPPSRSSPTPVSPPASRSAWRLDRERACGRPTSPRHPTRPLWSTSTVASAWSTERDDALHIELFNPFPGDAIVDLSFTTDEGATVPHDFQGLVVPARGMIVVDVGSHVRRRADIATTVVARTGRVVAGRLQIQSAPPAVNSVLGAPATPTTWPFPDGFASDGVNERYRVYNPGTR